MISSDLLITILYSGLGLFFLIQLAYFLIFYAKPFWYQKKVYKGEIEILGSRPPVSIIICSKNESVNLARCLPSILEQDYPVFEVIVVNDGSTDETEQVLGQLETQYKNIYRTYIPEGAKYVSHKKLAATVGIKAARYDMLLFIEPYCEAVSKDWITMMSRHFIKNKSIVLGFSSMSQSTGFLTKFAAYDNLINGLQYLSLALFNHPYRGVGRNLGYRKELFFDNKGYSKHLNLMFGEDDLFINQVADSENTAVEISYVSTTTTRLENFSLWRKIRLNQATTQRYYNFGPVLFWRLESWSRCFFLGFVIASIVFGFQEIILPVTAVSLFLCRLLVQLLIINKTSRNLGMERFYCTLPLFDFLQPLFDLYISLSRLRKGKKDYTWRN